MTQAINPNLNDFSTKLTPCASLLYYWMQSQSQSEELGTMDWQDFQVWTEEFRVHAVEIREIDEALRELIQLGIVTIDPSGLTINKALPFHKLQIPSSLKGFSLEKVGKSPLFWAGCMVAGVIALWMNVLFFSPQFVDLSNQRITPTNPYNVLGEKLNK